MSPENYAVVSLGDVSQWIEEGQSVDVIYEASSPDVRMLLAKFHLYDLIDKSKRAKSLAVEKKSSFVPRPPTPEELKAEEEWQVKHNACLAASNEHQNEYARRKPAEQRTRAQKERVKYGRVLDSEERKNEHEFEEYGRFLTKHERWDKESQRLHDKLRNAMQEFADGIRLEVTKELLSSSFALGDGSSVTWGDATVAQHEQRIDMLTKNAAGNLETAARHKAAIRELSEAGVSCLKEVPVAAAVD